jgi:hypothetical protein
MTPPLYTPLRTFGSIVGRSVLFLFVWALLVAPTIVPFRSKLAAWEETDPLRARLWGDFAGLATMLAATWLMTRFVDHRPFRSIGFAGGRILRDLSAGLLLGTGWLGASLGGAWAAGWLTPERGVAISVPALLGASASVLFNVVTQQLLLCGYILQTIYTRTKPLVALSVSALLFAAYHAGAFHGAWLPTINVFGAGLLFAAAYRKTGNLWLPIGIHFAWNSLLGPVLGLTVSGSTGLGGGWRMFTLEGPAVLTGGSFGLEGGLIVTATTALVAGSLLFAGRGRPGAASIRA